MSKRLRTTVRILLGILLSLSALVLLAALVFGIAESVVEDSAYFPPLRERTDISSLLRKEAWTEEDIDVLYHQTGLARPALIALKGDDERILSFQEALYRDYEFGHEMAAFTTPHDILKGYKTVTDGKEETVFTLVPIAPMQDGDVIVSSSCHTFGWRNGHAALVVRAEAGEVLQCVGPGLKSEYGEVSWFQYASNFMVLRLKDKSAQERGAIARNAVKNLIGVDYSVLTGIFSPKDQGETPASTHCSHLVWQAYKNMGYDIDSDGGPVCTARDIANCDLFEVVQVFGFDQDKLWK